MKKYDKLLFVSHSDTTRGPMAEAIMQNKVILEDILIESKGMIALFPEPVNPKARDILEQHNLDCQGHEARQFSVDDFDSRTLILTMTEAQKNKIMDEYKEKVKNVYTVSEYCESDEGDIYNPIGKDLAEYGHCYDVLDIITTRLVKKLIQEEQ